MITGLARPATLKLTPLYYQSKTAVRREAGARTVVYKGLCNKDVREIWQSSPGRP